MTAAKPFYRNLCVLLLAVLFATQPLIGNGDPAHALGAGQQQTTAAGTAVTGSGADASPQPAQQSSSQPAQQSGQNAQASHQEETLEEDFEAVMRTKVFGISIREFSYSFLILLGVLFFRNVIVRFFFYRLKKLASHTRFQFDEKLIHALEKPASAYLLLLGVYLAVIILPFSPKLIYVTHNIFRGVTMVVCLWALLRVADVAIDVLAARTANSKALDGFMPLIRKTVKIFILVVGVVMTIDNLGFNVGGILATLGIGGAALAFASKDTVANGFGTLMIMLDRPFKVGDWIMVGDKVDGDVEEIGLRSTKVRTWPKTIISIPNGVLANEYINNWSRMPKRRVKQVLSINYNATADDMEGMVSDIRKLLQEDEGVEQSFMLVNFTDLDTSGMDILVYYFTKSIKWVEHMDVRQRVNLKIMRAVQDRGLSLAFPTQTLQFEGELASKMAGTPWESRWDTQAKGGAKPNSSGKPPSSGDSQLPGDFGPKYPL